jgi:hypothetical protein
MQSLRTSLGRDGLVREMDPDAINKEERVGCLELMMRYVTPSLSVE